MRLGRLHLWAGWAARGALGWQWGGLDAFLPGRPVVGPRAVASAGALPGAAGERAVDGPMCDGVVALVWGTLRPSSVSRTCSGPGACRASVLWLCAREAGAAGLAYRIAMRVNLARGHRPSSFVCDC